MAGVEFDVFPYAESTRRSLTFSYLAGFATYAFQEVTIFDTTSARKAPHQLGSNLGRLGQLATGYSYFVGFGVMYRFGSIYNNVVNPRFRPFDGRGGRGRSA